MKTFILIRIDIAPDNRATEILGKYIIPGNARFFGQAPYMVTVFTSDNDVKDIHKDFTKGNFNYILFSMEDLLVNPQLFSRIPGLNSDEIGSIDSTTTRIVEPRNNNRSKRKPGIDNTPNAQQALQHLEAALMNAVRNESFEEAARIRDSINKIKNNE
jgi:L-2-hydroxyglutarate oxidase LhgO